VTSAHSGVAVAVGVLVGVRVMVGVAVLVGAADAVGVCVFVAVAVAVTVGVAVLVDVAVGVCVLVGVGVAVLVGVGVAVLVGVGVGSSYGISGTVPTGNKRGHIKIVPDKITPGDGPRTEAAINTGWLSQVTPSSVQSVVTRCVVMMTQLLYQTRQCKKTWLQKALQEQN